MFPTLSPVTSPWTQNDTSLALRQREFGLIWWFTTITQSLNDKPTSSASITTMFSLPAVKNAFYNLEGLSLKCFSLVYVASSDCTWKEAMRKYIKKVCLNLSTGISRISPSSSSVFHIAVLLWEFVGTVGGRDQSSNSCIRVLLITSMILSKFRFSIQYRDGVFSLSFFSPGNLYQHFFPLAAPFRS